MAARYARENKIPYLGICLGMQWLIEFNAMLLNMEDANSAGLHLIVKCQLLRFILGMAMRMAILKCVQKIVT